jgi:hypothetical protein
MMRAQVEHIPVSTEVWDSQYQDQSSLGQKRHLIRDFSGTSFPDTGFTRVVLMTTLTVLDFEYRSYIGM